MTPAAYPAVIIFSDEQSWLASSPSGVTAIDFADFAAPTADSDLGYLSGLTQDGVTFAGVLEADPYLFVRSARPDVGAPAFLYGPPDEFACFTRCGLGSPGSGIRVTLPANVVSVSWDFANFQPSGAFGYFYQLGLQVYFDDVAVYTDNYTGSVFPWLGGSHFVGFTSSTPINSILIRGGGYPTVENFSFSSTPPSPTPEPATASYAAICSLGMAAMILKQPRAKSVTVLSELLGCTARIRARLR